MTSRNISGFEEIQKSLTEEGESSRTDNKTKFNTITISKSPKVNNKFNSDIHPLDFYTLGKVHDPPKFTSSFCQNRAFRSTSNDLITRNVFSLNNCDYDNLKNNKKPSILSKQNIKENNYLKPLDVYKTFQKYNLNSNVVNKETYNIEKEKIFVKSNISTIRKGMNLTFSNFINCKKQLLTENSIKNNTKAMRDIIDEKNLQRIKTEENIKKNKSNEFKNRYEFPEITKNGLNSDRSNINKPKLRYINPIDFSKKELKGNCLYFDKNNQQFLRHKNWWIPDK